MTSATRILVLFVVCGFAFPVRADTTSPIASITHADGSTSALATNGIWYLNRADCDPTIFANTQSPYVYVNVGSVVGAGTTPVIWIGTSCLTDANRSGSSSATCTQAVGGAAAQFTISGSIARIPIDALLRNQELASNESYDICPGTGNVTKTFFMFASASTGDIDASAAIEFTITADLSSPSAPIVKVGTASGDRTLTIAWTPSTTLETSSEAYYFASPGGCDSPDGGVDAAADAPNRLLVGATPPVNEDGFESDEAGADGSASLLTSDLGLAQYGETASVGLVIRDAAGNYSVLSKIVCVTKLRTYGICGEAEPGSAECPQGCAVARGETVAQPLAFFIMLVAAVLARRTRHTSDTDGSASSRSPLTQL